MSVGPIEFVNATVEEWVASYTGPPFHCLLADPPYELNMMGKAWDRSGVAFDPAVWAALAAHLLPGAMLLAFGGTRTAHRLTCAIEDAGFEIREGMAWMFASGFPKSLNVALELEKRLCELRGPKGHETWYYVGTDEEMVRVPPFRSPDANDWAGRGTAVKPCFEPVTCARWPFRGTVAANALANGTGTINIHGCRVGLEGEEAPSLGYVRSTTPPNMDYGFAQEGKEVAFTTPPAGRYPPAAVFTHAEGCRRVGTKRVKGGDRGEPGCAKGKLESPSWGVQGAHVGRKYGDADGTEEVEAWECVDGCPVAELARQSGELPSGGKAGAIYRNETTHGGMFGAIGDGGSGRCISDKGTAARFFPCLDGTPDGPDLPAFIYQAKASRGEREAGCEEAGIPVWTRAEVTGREEGSAGLDSPRAGIRSKECDTGGIRCHHPAVKPLALTSHLARLILPPPHVAPRRLLVPFGGVGSEAIGAALEGWEVVVCIEQSAEYVAIAEARAAWHLARRQLTLFDDE